MERKLKKRRAMRRAKTVSAIAESKGGLRFSLSSNFNEENDDDEVFMSVTVGFPSGGSNFLMWVVIDF